MLLALLLAVQPSAWIPARWPSSDPKSLDLIRETPINCLLLEEPHWSRPFASAAAGRGIVTLAVVYPAGADSGNLLPERIQRALSAGLTGVLLEGDFPVSIPSGLKKSKTPYVSLPPRLRLGFGRLPLVAGSAEGVWPGVRTDREGETKAGPTASAWIDINTGFLRYLQALHPGPIWLGNRPPPNTVFPPSRYIEAIGDAAMTGARWVVALDTDFSQRVLTGQAEALRGWKEIGQALRFDEEHAEWREWGPGGSLALIEDAASGALFSGGIADLIAAKHAPVRVIPNEKFTAASLDGVRLAITLAPGADPLDSYERQGGDVLRSPPGWKYQSSVRGDFTPASIRELNEFPNKVVDAVGRRNFGARLFNVSTMLSNLIREPDGRRVVLELVKYSDLPVESITVHLSGKFTQARLFQPGADPQQLQPYAVEEGTGLDIDKVTSVAAIEVQ